MPGKVNKSEFLEPEKYYHIYNRAVGSELLFREENDYLGFLENIERFLLPVSDLIAYCLIPNHFHFFVHTLSEKQIIENLKLDLTSLSYSKLNQAFSNAFNSYTKGYNYRHSRKGKLFMLPYNRILVEDESYFVSIINYIHRNPLHHGLTELHTEWKYSSYNAYLSGNTTRVNRELGLEFYGDIGHFVKYHLQNKVNDEWLELTDE